MERRMQLRASPEYNALPAAEKVAAPAVATQSVSPAILFTQRQNEIPIPDIFDLSC